MKYSIITICFNSENVIEKTINSVLNQNYDSFEYIIVDGKSSDNTNRIISKYQNKINKVISEQDNGIYDAINKGICSASGDFIILLHAGDVFTSKNSLKIISKKISNNKIYLFSVNYHDSDNNICRNYSIKNWSLKDFEIGIMPPHLGFVCPRIFFKKYGYYKLDYQICSDFDLLFNFLVNKKLKYECHDIFLTSMSLGGLSTRNLFSSLKIQYELKMILNSYDYEYTLLKILKKYFKRKKEFVNES